MPEQGYDYVTDGDTGDMFAIQRSTGEVTKAVTMIVPEGSYFKTPEDQEVDRRRSEGLKKKQEQTEWRRQKNENLKELGKYFFALCEDFTGLSDATVARLIFLATFLPVGNEGCLCKTERTPMTVDDLPDLMKLSSKTVRAFLKEASAYIETDERGCLRMIGDRFARGKLKTGQYAEMQRLYRDSIRNLYRSTPVSKHRLLGVVFRLLPYVNREYNILCRNPGEECIDDVDLISLSDFCKLIGHDYLKMYRLRAEMKKLTFDVNGKRELFCNFVDAGGSTKNVRIFVNPHIMYNGSDYKKVEVLGKFCEL